MPNLHVAFWNVQNLFEPKPASRGPADDRELDAKVDTLAGVIDGLFDGNGPDLLGLAEIDTEGVLANLERRLRSRYVHLFEPGPDRWTGLSVLARVDRFADVDRIKAYREWDRSPQDRSMPRYLIARCQLKQCGEPIVFVVNHWRSRLGGRDAASERRKTARDLGDWLAGAQDDTCVVVVGDFNAEPFEEPFGDLGLRAVRHFSPDLWTQLAPACLYNTAWRFLCEPDPWEVVEAGGAAYDAPRPMTTYADPPPVLLDQLLVSGRALRGGPITLLEQTVGYPCAGVAVPAAGGHKRPARWTYAGGQGSGASDHFPLVATFRINGGDYA
jgi:predicted extracellular nuclease